MSGKIKICGLTRYEDAALAASLGAWALGFILWPKSKRSTTSVQAAKILDRLKDEDNLPEKRVGVFVNASQNEIQDAVESIGLTTIQLHGDETPEFVADLPYEIIKAFRLASIEDLQAIADYQADYFLCDAAVSGAYGGTGQLANWQLALQVKAYGPLILSGGINAENAGNAIVDVQPFALDLASGVESFPGIKSHDKLKSLFAII